MASQGNIYLSQTCMPPIKRCIHLDGQSIRTPLWDWAVTGITHELLLWDTQAPLQDQPSQWANFTDCRAF